MWTWACIRRKVAFTWVALLARKKLKEIGNPLWLRLQSAYLVYKTQLKKEGSQITSWGRARILCLQEARPLCAQVTLSCKIMVVASLEPSHKSIMSLMPSMRVSKPSTPAMDSVPQGTPPITSLKAWMSPWTPTTSTAMASGPAPRWLRNATAAQVSKWCQRYENYIIIFSLGFLPW